MLVDNRGMTLDALAMSQPHFSGVNTRLIVEYLRDKMLPGTLDTVLEAAGETRSIDVLLDDTSWSSYRADAIVCWKRPAW